MHSFLPNCLRMSRLSVSLKAKVSLHVKRKEYFKSCSLSLCFNFGDFVQNFYFLCGFLNFLYNTVVLVILIVESSLYNKIIIISITQLVD